MHSKTGVNNPAYGVSLNTPQRATAIHQASSAMQPLGTLCILSQLLPSALPGTSVHPQVLAWVECGECTQYGQDNGEFSTRAYSTLLIVRR